MFIYKMKFPLVLSFLLSLIIFTSCGEDVETPVTPPPLKSIVQTALGTPELSTLVAAVKKAGLIEVISAPGAKTVFAPNNEAFSKLLKDLEVTSLEQVDEATLKSILLHHVIIGTTIKKADLSDTYVNTASTVNFGGKEEPLSLRVATADGVKFNGTAKPVATDISATDGIIHVIDKVMLPPTVVDLAAGNDNFSSLVAALKDKRHTTKFLEILNGDGPFTVFAPTNEAFKAFLDGKELKDIPVETLAKVLKYHVIKGSNIQADQLKAGAVATLLDGQNITIDLTDGAKIKTSSQQTVNIVATDVQGKNGVVHVINKVLMPTTEAKARQ